MGSWTYNAHRLNITNFKFSMSGEVKESGGLDLNDFSMNSPWVVTSREENSIFTKKYDCCPEPYMHVDYRSALDSSDT